MFIDKNLMFHDDTVVAAATEYKGDSIALSVANEMTREGNGEGLEVLVQLTGDFVSGTSLQFAVITAPEASLATDQLQTVAIAVPVAQSKAGKKVRLPLNMVVDDTATHFGLLCTSLGTHVPSGSNPCTFSAWVQRVGEDQNSYS